MLILLILVSAVAWAQTAVLTAPWLVVYDPEGRPRWEIRLEKLVRTKEAWTGENASVTLFFQGEPTLRVRAPRISADSLGLRWTLSDGLSGDGQGFTFTAREAYWDGRLILRGFSSQGKNMELKAEEARWELTGTLELFSAEVRVSVWTLRFSYGKYEEPLLTAQEVEAVHQDLLVQAEYFEFYLGENRAKFVGAKVVRRP